MEELKDLCEGGKLTKESILITGGRIIDPARNRDEIGDVYIEGGRICAKGQSLQPDLVINAEGCLVLPGLIDFHAHFFFNGTDSGIPVDAAMLPNCVTTAVDGGSAGTANYEMFHQNVVDNSLVRVKSFLGVPPTGQITAKYEDNYDPQYYDEDKMQRLFAKYPGELLGLKLKQSKDVIKDLGLTPMKKALEIAERLSCRVAVHTTDPFPNTTELVNLFREGDIYIHVYHGKGSTIVGVDGKVLPAVKDARARGVIFDAANGKNHFSFKTAEAALRDGFAPDIISSDLTWLTMFKQPVFGLPWLMSKYLALGMSLNDVVAACTSTPAHLLKMEDEIGTLSPGACADVAILKLIDSRCEFFDADANKRIGEKFLMPQATVRAGRIVYRQMNF